MRFSKEVKKTLWNLIDDMSLKALEFTVHPNNLAHVQERYIDTKQNVKNLKREK